jgi:hypothetical protein
MPMNTHRQDIVPLPRVCSMPPWEVLAPQSAALLVVCCLRAWAQRECIWFSAYSWLWSWCLLAWYGVPFPLNRSTCPSRSQHDKRRLRVSKCSELC